MSKFYKNGFFENQVEGSVEISNERWQELLEGQSNGLEIYTKDDGEPDLREPLDTRNYAEKRAAEYPDYGEQFDTLWHAMNDGVLPKVPAFYNPIKKVKENNPKPQAS